MTEPSRALVEAAKRVLHARAAVEASFQCAFDAETALWRASGNIAECHAAYDIARTELAAESASPPTSGSSTTTNQGEQHDR